MYPNRELFGKICRKSGGRLFKIRFSQYINDNLAENDWTYKDLNGHSGVPTSTICAYAQGKVNNPDDDNLRRIAQAFGDPPEIIQQMRREAMGATVAENKIIAASDDKQRMEQLGALLRTNMLAVMEEYRAASAAQQTELLQHTEQRIAAEQEEFRRRSAEVVRQCHQENDRKETACSEKLDLMEKHCNQRIEDMRAHMADVLHEKRDAEKKMSRQYARNRAYLRSSVRNLCIAGGILLVTNIFFGAYAIFAYTVFD
ncbi:MAG: helix-turn-helix transcriptional regulator, partial [Clostridia bacterium]|nr:helix-turn-helix transcriptional regulator [Clostridia bacterium]